MSCASFTKLVKNSFFIDKKINEKNYVSEYNRESMYSVIWYYHSPKKLKARKSIKDFNN